MRQRKHLSRQQLLDLIHDTNRSTVGEQGLLHLDVCSICQEKMEEISAHSQWWQDQGNFVRSTMEQMNSSTELDRQMLSSCQLDITRHEDSILAGNLEAPTHPEFLGRLGPYEIESVIGRGGMGVVYKGFDTELQRVVAIKMLLPHLANNGPARQRFQREARSAAGISHANVVEIYHVHSNVAHPYLVMQFVQGDSLQKTVDRHGSLESETIASYGSQIAEGLAAAHEQGLVHRDIKPANILRRMDSQRVFITDFGLARTIDEANFTCTGLVVGTPHYMSPEQCNGRRAESSSDLFSLGCLLYFLATGRPPFRGESSMSVMNRICHSEHRKVTEINPLISPPLANVIDKLLAKEQDNRFESATETADVLKQVLAHIQKPDENPAPAISIPKPPGNTAKHKWLAWIGVAIGIFLFSFGAGVYASSFLTSTPYDQHGSNIAGNQALIDELQSGSVQAQFEKSDDGMNIVLTNKPAS